MRDYSKISSSFWTGKTGRSLRGDITTQLVALYLMTSPHADMIGVFHCPLIYIAHETGCPIEGASKALRRLFELDFCTFDEESEMVWVHEMAKFQIGDDLDPRDKRIKGVQKYFDGLAEGIIKQQFFKRYGKNYHLFFEAKSPSPIEAPSKPLRSQEQEQEQKKEQEQDSLPLTPSAEKNKKYRFSGQVIKLNETDYDRWKSAFPSIADFDAELRRCDDSVRDKPKEWFVVVSNMLNAKHQRNVRDAQPVRRAPRQAGEIV